MLFDDFNLYHSMGKFSRWEIDDIFLFFSQKTDFDISWKLSSNPERDVSWNLLEMSKSILWKKKKKKKNEKYFKISIHVPI